MTLNKIEKTLYDAKDLLSSFKKSSINEKDEEVKNMYHQLSKEIEDIIKLLASRIDDIRKEKSQYPMDSIT